MHRSYLIIIILLVSVSFTSYSQDNSDELDVKAVPANISSEALRNQALNVFLDCRWCDRNYIKQVIPYVNYVTNKDEADVHILVRRQTNGGGGGEYIIDFIGQGEFEEVNDQLVFVSTVDETRDETRIARSGIISMGLMQFVARTPVGKNIKNII